MENQIIMTGGKGRALSVRYRDGLLLMMVCALLLLLGSLGQTVSAATTGTWQSVGSQVAIKLSNPLRSPRNNNDATQAIQLSNSAANIAGPLRLVIGALTPADKVKIGAPDGQTDAGEAFFNLKPYLGGDNFATNASATVKLTVFGGTKNTFSMAPRVERLVAQELTVKITSPASLITVGRTPITVQGTVSDPSANLTLNGAPVKPGGDGSFSANVSLQEGNNTVIADAKNAAGQEVTDSLSVSLDRTPPYVTIESPADGTVVYDSTVDVSGLVNDIVRGTVSARQANVTVNGKTATVSNRSYSALAVPLAEGSNTLSVSAADDVGNVGHAQATVIYTKPGAKHIQEISGNNQSGKIGTAMANPLKVQLVDEKGQPVSGQGVIFRVTQGDGVVGVGTADIGQASLANTGTDGTAATGFQLGSRAGQGNQRVRATAVGFDGEVIFSASADPSAGSKVSVNSGNNQRGAVSQPLPLPLVAVVTDDGANVVAGASIEFKVTQGSGTFQNGQASYTVKTDSDGRASAKLTLGPEEGLDGQRATATLVGTSLYAGFTASGLKSGDAGNTRISGVVQDNQDAPLPKVTVRVDGTTRQAETDAQGKFQIDNAPVGPMRLVVDGSTTTVAGEWPTLPFNIVTIAGADNPLPAPVHLVKLDIAHAVTIGNQDAVITLADVPGFKLEVKAGSATFPDGKKTGKISVTPVNADKVPMPPPNGMQPQFIVTIQPVGTKFDPPAKLTLPNVDGHKPGAQVEMYSFDHDLEEFVSIGLGTVSPDGSLIASNPGVGVIKAGWHCGSQPSGSGCTHNCPECASCDAASCTCNWDNSKTPTNPNAECQKCQNGAVPDPAKNDTCCGGGSSICKTTGACTPVTLDTPVGMVNGKNEDTVAFTTGGTSVNFTGTATGSNCDPDYTWDFGDPASSATVNAQIAPHTYANPGEYTATVKVKCKKCGPGEKPALPVKVYVVRVDLNVANPTLTLLRDNNLEAKVTPASVPTQEFKFEIRRASEATWYELQKAAANTYVLKAKVAGKFKLRVTAKFTNSLQIVSDEKDQEIQFPDTGEILAGAGVQTRMDTAWTNTKSTTTATTRREEGYYITLDTLAETYGITAYSLGTTINNNQGAGWDTATSPRPPDSIANPTPLDTPTYTVAWFHTHTPTVNRATGRPIGPSGADFGWSANANINCPGYAYDYVESPAGSGNIPAGYPINSAAMVYTITPPSRRPTP
jgi:hypothetical protein